MNVLFLPLDERPCNAFFPKMLENGKLSVNVCPQTLLGNKKQAGNMEGIREFLLENCEQSDYAVVSLDTLIYGGLLPSRLHHTSVETLKQRLHTLHEMKKKNPSLKIFAFQCIMRCPQYNSSEEEPEYYADYGYALFRKKYLQDKKERNGLDKKEEEEWNSCFVPEDILQDYEQRRQVNISMNLESLKYVQEGTIDFYVIPQDDSSPFGYTALDQKTVLSEIDKEHLQFKTMVYPGADEVGQSLITRAYTSYYGLHPKIYPYYSSILGPALVPKYEDRPMFESLKSHVRVVGARLCSSEREADYLLAVNSPGKIMQEAFDEVKDVSYSSYRELLSFAERIQEDCRNGRKVIVCDSAYSNGGDLQLIRYLDELEVLDRVYAYGGWNTNCNTLGTVLSVALTAEKVPVHTNLYRVIEDGFYQAEVRLRVVKKDLEELHLGYYDFKDAQMEVERRIGTYLMEEYGKLKVSEKYPISSIEVTMPWKRMFEMGMHIHWK